MVTDASRIRTGHGPENFALMRRMAISLRLAGDLNQTESPAKSETGSDG